jgi:hypothetical protein
MEVFWFFFPKKERLVFRCFRLSVNGGIKCVFRKPKWIALDGSLALDQRYDADPI